MPRQRKRIGTKPKGARSKQNAASKRSAETKRQLLQLAELETDSGASTDPAWTWGDFLLGVEDGADPAESIIEDEVAMELTDLDGDTAQGFFVIVGKKPFRYEPDQDVDDLAASLQASCRRQVFQKLTQDVKCAFQDSDSVCVLLQKGCKLRLTSMYDSSIPSLKFCLSISDDLSPSLVVHQGIIPPTHDFWIGLPRYLFTATDVLKVLDKVENWSICSGNCEEQFQSLVPVGVPFCDTTMKRAAYKESVYGATGCETTIRSTKCHLLIRSGGRCQFCSLYRKTLWKAVYRNKAKMEAPQDNNLMSSKISHTRMSRDDLCLKVTQFKEANRSLSGELDRLRRDIFREIKDKGQTLSEMDDFDLVNMLKSSKSDVESAYPDENSLPRIFWEQQLRHANNKTARWHPMVIRWCLYMRSKSAKAYDAMRDMGFISLPSERTLLDYSKFLPSRTGFVPECADHLKQEAEKLGMFTDSYRGYVGILQDEIRVSQGLVYDKHSGELVGFTNLEETANDLCSLQENMQGGKKQKKLATSMLVIMVRGATSTLRYPLACFATTGVTSELLYPIIWQAVKILEYRCKLKVLFITIM